MTKKNCRDTKFALEVLLKISVRWLDVDGVSDKITGLMKYFGGARYGKVEIMVGSPIRR